MNQKPTQKFVSQCERACIYVENDMPIGVFHDFLMEIKGLMVDRMVVAHKEQEAQNESMKEQVAEATEGNACEAAPCDAPQES